MTIIKENGLYANTVICGKSNNIDTNIITDKGIVANILYGNIVHSQSLNINK